MLGLGRVALLSLLGTFAIATFRDLPVKLEVKISLTSRSANVHLSEAAHSTYPFTVTYGGCHASIGQHEAHHTLATVHEQGTNRLVWILPEDITTSGCLSAWSALHELVGRSELLTVNKYSRQWKKKRELDQAKKLNKRASIPMTNASGIDAEGPWFDGVEVLKVKEISAVNVKQAKSKKIAIVGAGMAGLMTFLCLNMSGFHNLEIIEAGQRLGGRVHTAYLEGGPFDYQYQEMGPMRFPETIQYAGTNETLPINDQRLVFQLADIMNQLNKGHPNFTVNWIPWIQSDPNGLYYFNGIKKPNGLPPTVTEVGNDKNLTAQIAVDPTVSDITDTITELTCDPKLTAAAAKNVFAAHKAWLDTGLGGLGGDDWSEFAYFHNYLKYSLNATDQALATGFSSSGDGFWEYVYSCGYFQATEWRTIDGGLNRLPYSFYPHVDSITTMDRSIERAEFLPETNQVQLSWKKKFTDIEFQSATYDYAMISVPFSKVALQFETRFWEHYDQPIFGGCSTTTDIPGIGSICYPSYKLNATGRGVMLASYTSGDFGLRFSSLTDEEHVQYVLNAMIEIHGPVAREQYTGRYNRRCWVLDPLESASWASPSIGMHKLYIPAYFKTENSMIFIGEHTSYTHAWISSALESGIRGSVQLLLELGLVDEAKAITEKFMARFISI
ncbi:hypothetical protein MMC07_001548 [Pseudocyphellaria aurata]|nr:hypothetical protein [Pseudocyphellaria aurata]